MIDLRSFNMFRIVTENCMSGSGLPNPTQHENHRMLWQKGEIIQLIGQAGDFYIAKSITHSHSKDNEHHIVTNSFRELTSDERKQAGLPSRVGAPIEEE